MALFKKKRDTSNWDYLKSKEFNEQAQNRDVHREQNLERSSPTGPSKPIKERVLAFFVSLIFGGIGYAFGCILLFFLQFFEYVRNSNGASFLAFQPDFSLITSDFRLYIFTFFVFIISFLIANEKFMMVHNAKNSMHDNTDINSYTNDQKIMLFEEMQETFDWFPDTGCHSSVQVSSVLGHVMLDNKGLKKIDVAKRHKKDLRDEKGNIIAYKGETIYNDDGSISKSKMSLIDEEFGQDLFTASSIPLNQKKIRTPFTTKGVKYNPVTEGNVREDRDKLDYDTVDELINDDWVFPSYEVQRPAGAYLVDTAPTNTMVLAITRAGKG